MKEKMTAKDYREEYNDLTVKLSSLDVKIAMRLLNLCKRFPEVPVARQADLNGTIIKAKSIANVGYINELSITARLKYIETIEFYNAEQQAIRQTKIDF